MKIAYVFDMVHPYIMGGVQKRIWELAKRLAQKGHEITIFGMKYWDGAEVIHKEGVRFWGVCPAKELYVNGRRSISKAIYFAWRVLLPLSKERFDVIDCQNMPYFPCFSAKLASLITKSPLVITWHEVWDSYWFEYLGKRGLFGKLVEKLTAGLACEAIAVSAMTEGQLRGLGIEKNIRVIPNGIYLEDIEKVVLNDRNSDIVFAGRLIKEKNVDLLIKAVSLLKKEIPNVNCVIIGDGPERLALQRLASDLKLKDTIQFTGFLESDDEVISYIKASKVFVLPSTREGFGIVVLEANACGLPVVTVRHPRNAATELITNGENGYICELSEKDMAKKILIALNNKENMKHSCRKYSKRYDWDEIACEAEAFYEETLAK
jgi:glycosyltransferase involved in cell wall biosynthesis